MYACCTWLGTILVDLLFVSDTRTCFFLIGFAQRFLFCSTVHCVYIYIYTVGLQGVPILEPFSCHKNVWLNYLRMIYKRAFETSHSQFHSAFVILLYSASVFCNFRDLGPNCIPQGRNFPTFQKRRKNPVSQAVISMNVCRVYGCPGVHHWFGSPWGQKRVDLCGDAEGSFIMNVWFFLKQVLIYT